MKLLFAFLLGGIFSATSFAQLGYKIDVCESTGNRQAPTASANCSTVPKCNAAEPCAIQVQAFGDRIGKDTGSISESWWKFLKQLRFKLAPVSDKSIRFEIVDVSGNAIYMRVLNRDNGNTFKSEGKPQQLNYKPLKIYGDKPSLTNARKAAKSFFAGYDLQASSL